MTTFTIDTDNNITAFPTPDHAEAAVAAGAQAFGNQQALAELAASWPADRLVAVYNSLPGVAPVQKFKNSKTAISRIWARIQHLGEPKKPAVQVKANVGAQVATGAPTKAKAHKKASRAKKAAKPPKKAKKAEIREGSKTAAVVTMLQRKSGATLAEIISKTGWQKHYADVQIMPTCVGNPAFGAGIAAMESA